jgi:hypothetical protein
MSIIIILPQKIMIDRYIKIDDNVELIVKRVSMYMRNLNYDYIRNEIFKAYIYSREAHD